MAIQTTRLTRHLRNYAATSLGLVMAATPLALWVAWNQTVFILVLVVFAAAVVLFSMLPVYDEPGVSDWRDHRDAESTARLSDEFLSELSNMGPWVYHHRRLGDPDFQRKMDLLKKK
jgi:hypothetical protein